MEPYGTPWEPMETGSNAFDNRDQDNLGGGSRPAASDLREALPERPEPQASAHVRGEGRKQPRKTIEHRAGQNFKSIDQSGQGTLAYCSSHSTKNFNFLGQKDIGIVFV